MLRFHNHMGTVLAYMAIAFLLVLLAGCAVGGGFHTPIGEVETRASIELKPTR